MFGQSINGKDDPDYNDPEKDYGCRFVHDAVFALAGVDKIGVSRRLCRTIIGQIGQSDKSEMARKPLSN